MSKLYQSVTKAEQGRWVLDNQTTSQVIRLKLEDADLGKPQFIWLTYPEFEDLKKLIETVSK